jgi:signal transduction histidine kinase
VPSRTKKRRNDSSGSADYYRADAAAADFGHASRGGIGAAGNGSVGSELAEPAGDLGGPPGGSGDRPALRQAPARLLRNWRVRSRLVLLIAIPTTTAVALGAVSIVSSWQSAVADQRTETLASDSTKICQLAYQIEAERDAIVWYIAAGVNGRAGRINGHQTPAERTTSFDQLSYANQQISYTDPWIKTVTAEVDQIGAGYPAAVQLDAHAVASTLTFLPALRSQAKDTQLSASDVIQNYGNVIAVLLAFDDQVALSSSDPQLTSTARALSSISQYENEDSVQRAIIMYALTPGGGLNSDLLSQLTTSRANQQADDSEFQNFATPTQITVFSNDLGQSLEDRVIQDETTVTQNPNTAASLPIPNTEWWGDMTDAISATHNFEEYLANAAVSRAQDLRGRAIISAIIAGGIILLVLVLALLFTVFVGRSMVRPLRRLRAGALEVAGVRLPETVRRMSEADGENVPVEVEPIDVESSDEIGEVARAFDQVHREALRLAATEAALRGNVNAMFVNLSRRSQSLVERQIRLIDELEQGEQDSDRLGSLFQMDHLATRMRRNSENLLVLAGHESSRRWNQPVPLVDVLRAAISEIEQYERVMLNVQPGIAVRGPAVNDVVHLIAELAENATSFSSAETPVSVSGHMLGSGGVLLDITDEGVGMGGEEMAHANWRLDNPPVVDVAVSRRMGLFVVARLAARHGVRVRLRPATGNGLTALVWLPDEVIVHESANGAVDPGRLPDQSQRMAIDRNGLGGSGSGPGGWVQPGPPSAYDEVAAARARFSPLQPPDSDFGRSGIGPPEISQPGFGQPAYGQPGFGGRDREFGTGQYEDGRFGTGQFGTGQFGGSQYADDSQPGQRQFQDRQLGGPGFDDRGFGDQGPGHRRFASSEFAGPGDTGNMELGPQRVPGAGPHPGQFTTGPIPAVDTGPGLTVDHPEWFAATGHRFDADVARGGQDGGQASQPDGSYGRSGPGTGPIPVVGDPAAQWQQQADRQTATGPIGGDRTWPGDQAQPSAPSWQAQQPAWGDRQPSHEHAAWRDERPDQRPEPVFGAPVAGLLPLSGTFRTQDSRFGTTAGGVILPPPASLGEENRLPIFEAVESDWFRRGRPSVEWPGGSSVQSERAPAQDWASPADEGWRAAEVAVAPASGGTTVAGLPRRVPQANLIPGTATAEAPAPAPARSAAATRERFASLQRGMREGRAATGFDRPEGTGEVLSDG